MSLARWGITAILYYSGCSTGWRQSRWRFRWRRMGRLQAGQMHHSTQTRVQTRSLATVLGMHCTVLFTLLLVQAIVDPASFARAAKLSLLQLSEVPQEDLNGLIAELGVATLQLKLQIKAAIKDAASVSSTPIADQTSASCASSTGKEVRCLRCGACSPPPPPLGYAPGRKHLRFCLCCKQALL